MTIYDSSVLIGYLDGDDEAVNYVEAHLDERAVAPPLVMFEVYQGEVFKAGPADFDAVEGARKLSANPTDTLHRVRVRLDDNVSLSVLQTGKDWRISTP